MADVARLAGVSLQTVSRVVNGQSNLRPATRERVEVAIRQLGYRPNVAARSLVTRRSATLGVIATKSVFWGPGTIYRAVQSAGRAAGWFMASVDLPTVTRDELQAAVEYLHDQRVEGIVLVGASDEALEATIAHDVHQSPMVVVEGDHERLQWTVGVDQAAGGRMATQHLIRLGHREIAHVAGPLHWPEARARLAGWQAALLDAGRRPDRPLVGDWTSASGYRAGLELARRSDVTAVFVANDQMAIGALRALHEAGRRVPDDISVVGFDDIPEAGYLLPPLTTVRQDFAMVGRDAIRLLTTAMEGDQAPVSRLIDPRLVLRASTAPPPKEAPSRV